MPAGIAAGERVRALGQQPQGPGEAVALGGVSGGEAAEERTNFAKLTEASKADLVRFLQNLVILKAPEEE